MSNNDANNDEDDDDKEEDEVEILVPQDKTDGKDEMQHGKKYMDIISELQASLDKAKGEMSLDELKPILPCLHAVQVALSKGRSDIKKWLKVDKDLAADLLATTETR